MKFFVENTAAGSHPLYIAGPYFTFTSAAVFVRKPALPRDCNGFKTLMRVNVHTAGMVGRPQFPGLIIVEQQKGTQRFPKTSVNIIPGLKSITHHMGLARCSNGLNCSVHGYIFCPFRGIFYMNTNTD